MKRKKKMIYIAVCLVMLLLAVGCFKSSTEDGVQEGSNASGVASVSNPDDTNDGVEKATVEETALQAIETFSYDNFADKQEWKYGLLLGDGQILSFGGPFPLYYTDLETGESLPLCSKEDCTHNNAELCEAIFSEHYGCDFVYCYDKKLYAASVLGNSIRIYCCGLNGENHESVAYDVLEGDVELSGYYVYEDCLYIGVSVENPDVEPLVEDSDGSYMVYEYPCIYRFDFAAGNLESVYRDEKGDYGASLEILYGLDGVLYFDSGEVDGRLSALEIATTTVSQVEGYDAGDYLGNLSDIYYYAECDKDGYETGDVRMLNLRDGTEDMVHLTALPKNENRECYIHLLEDGFVVNEQSTEEETGTMTFYDMTGKETDVVEDCSTYVIGEHQGLYLLGELTYSGVAVAYGEKEDVRLADSKERNEKIIYLYP